MAIDTNVQTFTDAELLALVNKAIADILVGGQATSPDGRRTLTRADLDTLMEIKRELETTVAAEDSETGGGIALVRYGERV